MKAWKQWQKDLVGKNKHRVWSRCPHCLGHGINFPLDDVCGNCGKEGCITFYDEETIDAMLAALKQSIWDAARATVSIGNNDTGIIYEYQYDTLADYEKSLEETHDVGGPY